jgi:hypothetical protein
MLIRNLMPLVLFILCCTTSIAAADLSHPHHDSQVHVHYNEHRGHAHIHTHTSSNPADTHQSHHACDDEHDPDHLDCCADHHESESKPVASLARPQDRPTDAPPTALPYRSPSLQTTPITPTRWLPVRQRPPNHLVLLRTFVMLN